MTLGAHRRCGGKLALILAERPFCAQSQVVDELDIMGNGSDRFKPLPAHHSQVRSMTAEAPENTYTAFTTFAAAREHSGSVVIFEGDYGGTIYLTIPVRDVACGETALKQLLFDIATMYSSDPRGARVLYEVVQVGAGVAGGMGGGQIVNGLWLHPKIAALGVREDVEQVLNGKREQIDTAGRERR